MPDEMSVSDFEYAPPKRGMGKQPEADIQQGHLCVDIESVFRCLDEKSRDRIAKIIGFEARMSEAFLKKLLNGDVAWSNGEYGTPEYDPDCDWPWYIGGSERSDPYQGLRKQIADHFNPIMGRMFALAQRHAEYLAWERDQYQSLLWKLARQAVRGDVKIASQIDFHHESNPRLISPEDVTEMVKRLDALTEEDFKTKKSARLSEEVRDGE